MGTTRAAPSSTGALPRPWSATPGLVWAVGLAVVLLSHAWVAWDAVAPVQTKDEIGYLAAARWLATGEGAGLLTPEYAGGYAVGWGLLTAPLWWFVQHPPTVYTASVAVNVALATGLLVPAAAVASRLGLDRGRAVLAATVVCVAAGRLGYTGYALPESLLTLQLTTLLWLLLRLHEHPRGLPSPRLVLAGAAALLAWLPTTHARFAPLAGLGLLLLLGWAWVARSRSGAAAAVLAAASAAAGWWLNGHVEAALYGDVARVDVAAQQVDGLSLADVATLAVGHAWYGAVAWCGLSLVGWLVAVGRTRGPDPWAWLVVGSVLQLGVGAAYLSSRLDDGGRVDQLVYGRYGDPVWFLLALVGVAALLAQVRPRRLLAASLAGLLVLCAAAVVAVGAAADRVAGFVQLNVPGIEAWAWRDGDGFVVPLRQASVLAVVVLVVLGAAVLGTAAAGIARCAAVGCVGLVLLGAAVVAERRNIEPRDAWIRSLFQVRQLVEQQPDAPVVLVVDRPLLLSGNALQWWLADRDPVVVEPGAVPAGTAPGTLLVGPVDLVGAVDNARSVRRDLVLLGTDPTGTYAVWELTG